jgi:hypothetical protein
VRDYTLVSHGGAEGKVLRFIETLSSVFVHLTSNYLQTALRTSDKVLHVLEHEFC